MQKTQNIKTVSEKKKKNLQNLQFLISKDSTKLQ